MPSEGNIAVSDPRTGILSQPVSILMPVYNEQDIIRHVLDEWIREVMVFLPAGSELVLDDCSNDGTEVILAEMAREYPFLRINTSQKDGFAKAARRLYTLAACPLIFFTDSDGQYVPSDFWLDAARMREADMVHGYKASRSDPFYRVISSRIFNMVVRLMFGISGSDINSAFRLMRRELIEDQLPATHCMPMLINAELYVRAKWAGYRIVDIPIQHRERPFGPSKSLPFKTFFWHGWRAFLGALELRAELRGIKRK